MSSERIIKNTWMVSALTLSSRVLGLIRDKALVLVFGGASGVLDAFFLAFTIPNLFRRLFGEGALSSAFIPEFVDCRENYSVEESNHFASVIFTALGLVLSIFSVAVIVICLSISGFVGNESTLLALKLTAMMLPFMPLICVSALLAGMLQCIRKFGIPAAMPVLLNITILGVLGYFIYYCPNQENLIYYVAGAVVIGGGLQVLIQMPYLWANGVYVGISTNFGHDRLKTVLKAMGPTVLGLAIFQINVLLDRLIAFLMVDESGALTHLYLGNRLMQLPLALFGISLVTTVFPDIVSHMKRKEWGDLFSKMDTSVRFLIFIMIPSAVGLIVVSEPVVRMIFQEPDLVFSDMDVYKTSAVLALYAPSLVFISIQQFITRVFYADGDYKTPVSISIKMVFLNVGLNIVLIHVPDLYQRWANNVDMPLGEAGLALSTTITSIISMCYLWYIMKLRLIKVSSEKVWDDKFSRLSASTSMICIASFGMGIITWLVVRSIPAEPELLVRVERGLISVIVGVASYIIICQVFEIKELNEFDFRKKNKEKHRNEA